MTRFSSACSTGSTLRPWTIIFDLLTCGTGPCRLLPIRRPMDPKSSKANRADETVIAGNEDEAVGIEGSGEHM